MVGRPLHDAIKDLQFEPVRRKHCGNGKSPPEMSLSLLQALPFQLHELAAARTENRLLLSREVDTGALRCAIAYPSCGTFQPFRKLSRS